ncbi:hypothetical protein J1605_003460 [Eschrichtius robustus]|uniref:Uncharacterized protein n=1 Tax=Eschrichtius robustus TaxID=9764 RepID=A0AB34HSD1_ESCRO|nr:hypothetical protein J1605_003460 [Eschrichtius robustus]
MIGLMARPLCPTLESQKARRYCYPISWLGLKTPKSLAHGCLGKGMCKPLFGEPRGHQAVEQCQGQSGCPVIVLALYLLPRAIMRRFPLFSGERPWQMPTASRCVRSEVICKGPVHVMLGNCIRRRCHSEIVLASGMRPPEAESDLWQQTPPKDAEALVPWLSSSAITEYHSLGA